MYSLKKKAYGYRKKSLRDEHITENYKVLKKTFFKSVPW